MAQPPEPPVENPPEIEEFSWGQWFQEEGYWYITSAVVHGIGFVIFALLAPWAPQWLGFNGSKGTAMSFDAVETRPLPEPLNRFDPGDPDAEPGELNNATLLQKEPPGRTAKYYDESEEFEDAGGGRVDALATGPQLGGLGGYTIVRPTPGVFEIGPGGVGGGQGTGINPGTGGSGTGFGLRGKGHQHLAGSGGTKGGERAVGAALNWLSRHQNSSGGWSIDARERCLNSQGCGGWGSVKSDSGATGLALLAFLGAGQTHKDRCVYQKTVSKGIAWLIKHQAADGDLSFGSSSRMYAHGIATLALCEAFGMTKDNYVGAAAAKGLRFIELAQNPTTGGWRYEPGDTGDTSVFGWQMMALKSGQMAGLGVNTLVFENGRIWLRSVAKGNYGGLCAYQPQNDPTASMTAVGMLCQQYLGAEPAAPPMRESKEFILAHPPSNEVERDTYYWYYATLAMHNFMDKDWDQWNRQMRRALVFSQCREGCAAGSWDPQRPSLDKWGNQGGRLVITCLSALTLEVYYRYLPLYKTGEPAVPPAADKTTLAHDQ